HVGARAFDDLDVRGRDAKRGELGGVIRNDEGAHASVATVRANVQWSGAANGQERKFAWIEAAADGHRAHEVRHPRVENVDNAERRVLDAEPQRLREAHANRLARRVSVELPRAAQKIVGIDPAEHHIRVGDGWLRAAAAVAHWARTGARALRTD